MAAEALIVRDGTVAVPLDYEVPVASAIEPLLISATFADPNNVGSYVPALELITPSGQELGPFPLGTTIAAGGSARVSWFPGVAGEVQVSAGTPAVPAVLYDYTLPSDGVSIDTSSDGPYAGIISPDFFLLEVWFYARTDEASAQSNLSWRINGDTGANYDRLVIGGIPTGAIMVSQIATTFWNLTAVPGAGSPGSYFSVARASFPNYSNRTGWLGGESIHAHPGTTSSTVGGAFDILVDPSTLGWRSTSDVQQIRIAAADAGTHLKAGSRLLIYGR